MLVSYSRLCPVEMLVQMSCWMADLHSATALLVSLRTSSRSIAITGPVRIGSVRTCKASRSCFSTASDSPMESFLGDPNSNLEVTRDILGGRWRRLWEHQWHLSSSMSSLLSHPDVAKADRDATPQLDSHFQNVEQLQLEDLLEQARCRNDKLQVKVRMYPPLNVLISITGSSVVRFE